MAKSAPIQLGFNGGRFDARMRGRTDIARYRLGCRTIDNFIPTVQGPALKRSGTRFVKRCYNVSTQTRLIPFEYSRDQAYILELSEGRIRFFRDSGAVLEATQSIVGSPTAANPCSVEVTGHGYSTGDEVYITGSGLLAINGQFFQITVATANTFTLGYSMVGESTNTGGTVARVYQIVDGVSSNSIPWLAAELNAVAFAQDADVMYLVHPNHPPHKLARVTDTSWTCTEVEFAWPQFREENITDTTVYASAGSGTTITIEASTNIFTSDMVGSYFMIGELPESVHPKWIPDNAMATEYTGNIDVGDRVQYEGNVYELNDRNGNTKTGTIPPTHDDPGQVENDRAQGENGFEWEYINQGYGYGKIETYTDANTIVVDVDNYGIPFPASVLSSGRATKKWAIGAFSAEYGYPSAVAFFEQRLWFGGTERDPQTFWGSRTNRYEDFQLRHDDPASGLQWTIADGRVNTIQWMTGEDALLVGTRGGEFTVQSNSQDSGITPDNVKVKLRSNYGSAEGVAPVFVDSALAMVQRDGKRLHELIYDFDTDRYTGADLTSFAHNVFGAGAVGVTYAASPHRQILVHTDGGELVTCTYVRDEDVLGWANCTIAGPTASTTYVESVAVIPHPDGDQDQVWMVVRRTINAGTQRWIEYLEKPFEEDDALEDGVFLDGSATYTGSAATTIYGLLHIAGQSIAYLRNGVAGTGTVGSTGKLTVTSTTKIHIGWSYSAELETLDFEQGQPPLYTTQGDRGRVVSAVFRLHNTGQGVEYGQSLDGTLDEWTQPDTLFTGDSPELTLPGGYSRSRRVAVRHSEPVPCTVVAIMPRLQSEAG